MSNELPQPPTEMCEPVITGSNELHKAIDEYWQSKYPKYATGRIKRMRNPIPKHRWPNLTKRIGCERTFLVTIFPNDVFSKALFGITRWNRH
jgi:hypothetical protein